MKRLAAALICLSLTACETPTYYQAALRPNAMGYADYQIEPGRYRVSFQGGAGAPARQVEDYSLLRAAQVALRDGYDWFRVVARDGERTPSRSGSAISIGGGSGGFGGGGLGIGLGTTFNLSGGPVVIRTMEILTGRGERPAGDDVYDARGVVKTLSPRAAP